MESVMRHEARQVPSWLIFDVRQKKTTMDDSNMEKEIERTVRRFRLFGWALLVVGGLMFALALNAALDPTASIRINGVETRDSSTKLGVVAVAAIFPLFGALLAWIPKQIFIPFIRAQFERVREIQRSFGMK